MSFHHHIKRLIQRGYEIVAGGDSSVEADWSTFMDSCGEGTASVTTHEKTKNIIVNAETLHDAEVLMDGEEDLIESFREMALAGTLYGDFEVLIKLRDDDTLFEPFKFSYYLSESQKSSEAEDGDLGATSTVVQRENLTDRRLKGSGDDGEEGTEGNEGLLDAEEESQILIEDVNSIIDDEEGKNNQQELKFLSKAVLRTKDNSGTEGSRQIIAIYPKFGAKEPGDWLYLVKKDAKLYTSPGQAIWRRYYTDLETHVGDFVDAATSFSGSSRIWLGDGRSPITYLNYRNIISNHSTYLMRLEACLSQAELTDLGNHDQLDVYSTRRSKDCATNNLQIAPRMSRWPQSSGKLQFQAKAHLFESVPLQGKGNGKKKYTNATTSHCLFMKDTAGSTRSCSWHILDDNVDIMDAATDFHYTALERTGSYIRRYGADLTVTYLTHDVSLASRQKHLDALYEAVVALDLSLRGKWQAK